MNTLKTNIERIAREISALEIFPTAKLVDVKKELYQLNTKGRDSFTKEEIKRLIGILEKNLDEAQTEAENLRKSSPKGSWGKRQSILRSEIFSYQGALKKLKK